MHRVLDELGDPVAGERYEHNQSYHFSRRASTGSTSPTPRRTSWVTSLITGLIFHIHADHRDTPPHSKDHAHEPPNGRHKEDVPKRLSHVHGLLQHHDRERYPRDPAHEADDGEHAEEGEHHRSAIIMLCEVVDRGPDAEHDVQDARDPDKLLCERARGGEVEPGDDEGDEEDEDEEDDGVSVEREVVRRMVDAPARGGLVGAVALEREARDGGEAEEGQDEEDAGPEVVVLGSVELEGLLEGGFSIPAQRLLLLLLRRRRSIGVVILTVIGRRLLILLRSGRFIVVRGCFARHLCNFWEVER